MQAVRGLLDNGRFTPYETVSIPNKVEVLIVFQEFAPLQTKNNTDSYSHNPIPWLDEFNRLLDESDDEVLNMEDFPRANFTRELPEVLP